MGEQARRRRGEDFMGRSIHEAIAWARNMRGRSRARRFLDTLYYSIETAKAPPPPLVARPPNPQREAFRKEARSRRERRVAMLRHVQGRACYLCTEPMTAPTLDHVMPIALGGRTFGNVLLAHSVCNQAKADRKPYPCELIYLAAVNAKLAEISGRQTYVRELAAA